MWIDAYCTTKDVETQFSQKENEFTIVMKWDKTDQTIRLSLNYAQARAFSKSMAALVAQTVLGDLADNQSIGDMAVHFERKESD